MTIFSIQPKIYHGHKSLSALDTINYGKVLVLIEQKYLRIFNENIFPYINTNQIEYISFDNEYNYHMETIEKVVFDIVNFNPEHILAIGSMELNNYAKLLRYYKNKTYDILGIKEKAKLISIPVPSAGGFESSGIFYYIDGKYDNLHLVCEEDLAPDIVIANPSLVDVYSLYDLQCMSFIALCNAIGSYSSLKSNEFSSMYADKAVVLIDKYLLLLQRNNNIINKISTLQLGSIMSGISMDVSGPNVILLMSLVLKKYFNLELFQSYSILAPHLMEYNSKNMFLNNVYSGIAKSINFNYGRGELNLRALIEYLKNLSKSLDLPSSLTEAEIDYQDIMENVDLIAKEIMERIDTLNTSVLFKLSDVRKILINII